MKRAAESDGGGDAKHFAGGDGGGGSKGGMNVINQKVDPIPRNLKVQEVTLHFTQRSWEEIGPGELKYLPLCQTPYYMLDEAMKKQLLNFKDLWSTMEIHQPSARITNMIMLQDDLVNQGGTPMETTAFTQVCYLLRFNPTKQTQYFLLGDVTNCKNGTVQELMYNMTTTKCGNDYSQLINVQNYKDFERLAILPARIDLNAGYDLTRLPEKTTITTESQIKDTFFSPTMLNKSLYSNFSANYQPVDPPVIDTLKQITWVRNLDKISFHKVGDSIEIPIVTNLNGKQLLSTKQNDMFTRTLDVLDNEGNFFEYPVEFVYPSNNRPYFDRSDNLSEISTNLHSKDMQPLSHTFFTMPPIRKANGALLKQRASVFLEQSFSVTFRFPESVWGEDSGSDRILNQRNGIVLRPILYSKLSSNKVNEEAICPNGDITCTGDQCPFDNSYASLIALWVQYKFPFKFVEAIPSTAEYKYTSDFATRFNNQFLIQDAFRVTYKTWLLEALREGSEVNLYIDLLQKAHVTLIDRSGNVYDLETENDLYNILVINAGDLKDMYSDYGITCTSNATQKAGTYYYGVNRDTKMFYV